MATIPYAFVIQNVNGVPMPSIVPDFNIDPTLQKVDYQTWLNSAQQAVNILASRGSVNSQTGQPITLQNWPYWQNIQQQYAPVIQAAQTGQTTNSGYQTATDPNSGQTIMASPGAQIDSSGKLVQTTLPQNPNNSASNGPAPQLATNQVSTQTTNTTPATPSISGTYTSPLTGTVYTSQAVAQQYEPQLAQNGSPTTTNSSSIDASTTSSSSSAPTDLGPFQALFDEMQKYITQLQANGQTINPNVTITPDQLAAFTAQAKAEIDPYYATQLQAATDSFLSGLGYNVKQLNDQVAQAQTTYGRNLDSLAASSADQGFAQSGIRLKQENQLASDTQNSLNQAYSGLQNSANNAARSFAQTYGGSNVPTAPILGSTPRVLPGVSTFDTSGSNSGLYTLNPAIYGQLIGSEQNSQKQAEDTLSSQLASNATQLASNSATRSLNTPVPTTA